MPSLTDLPPEILLKILSLLELCDVARIRQSCTRLRDVTRVRSIWFSLLEGQRRIHPISPWLDFCSPIASSLSPSTADVEHAVVTTHRIAEAWPQIRRPLPLKIQPRMGDMLFLLEMFLDRWLLVVYAEGLVYLLDTVSDPMVQPGRSTTGSRAKICAKLVATDPEGHAVWTSCAAQASEDGQKLVILLNTKPGPVMCKVYEVALGPGASFKLVAAVRLPTAEIIRSISFSDNMLVLSRGSAINLIDITKKPRRNLLVLSPYSEDLEDMWNGTIEVRVFHRYLFAFKARSIEVHAMDSLLGTTQCEFTAIPVAKRFFHNTTFRDIRISTPSTPVTTAGDRIETKFQIFAYDVLQGLFNYAIHFQTQPDQSPLFTVVLLNIYPLSNHVVPQFARLLPDLDSHTPSPTPTNETRSAFRQVNLSSRGFLSAHAIGPQAKRAVWVERVRGDTTREVQVWSSPGEPDDGEINDGPPGEIQRIAIHTITSPDLREDIIRCALNEAMGLIVLGNRAGEIFLLDVDI